MTTLKEHIAHILRSRDFEVEDRAGYVYGRREDVSVVVMAANELSMTEVQEFLKDVEGFPGRKVVVSLRRADEALLSYLQSNGVHYWGREEVEHELGNLQLETVSEGRGRSLLDEVISDEFPQRLIEPPEQSIPVIVESAEERAERIVKPNFLLEDVKYLASHEIDGYRFELELVPHYLFHYVLSLDDGKQRAGIAAVNALTNHVETWRWGFELVDSIDIPHSKREPKIDYERARQLAEEMVEKEQRGLSETVRDFGHSEIIERKGPKPGSVLIEPKGLVYLPVWCVEGRKGAMIVNSSSGKIISEHLHGNEASETTLG